MANEGAKPPKIIRSGVIPAFEKGQGGVPVFPPTQWPIGLLFLQNCWNRLRYKQAAKENVLDQPTQDDADATLPVAHFQRVMVRLIKYLNYDPRILDTRKYVIEGTNKVDWRSFADCWRDLKLQTKLTKTECIFLGFDPAGASSCMFSQFVSTVVFITIVLSSISFILSTLQGDLWQYQECPTCKPKPRPIFSTIEDICAVVFTTEFLARLLFCCGVRLELLNEEDFVDQLCSDEPVRWLKTIGRLQKFCAEKSNIIDFLAIVPYYFEKFVNTKTNLMVLRLVRLTRMFRILRLGKLSDAMDTLVETFNCSLPSLYVLSFYICLGVLVSSSIVFYVEAGVWDPENQAYFVEDPLTGEMLETSFTSIPTTFWWTIVTVTTVGYGDLYPTTPLGKLFGSITIVAGVIAFAMPVGVISSNFSHCWEKAQREKAKGGMAGLSIAAAESKAIDDGFEHAGLKKSEIRFEVHHIEPPAEPLFIGMAILDLSRLDWNIFEKTGRAVTLKLEGDAERTRKGVSGTLNVNLLWEPGDGVKTCQDPKELHQYIRNCGELPNIGSRAQKLASARDFCKVVKDFWSRPPTPNLKGNLIIEIVSAERLAGKNARVDVFVHPGLRPGVKPIEWKTKAARDTNHPDFGEIQSFALDWRMHVTHKKPSAAPSVPTFRQCSTTDGDEANTTLGDLLPPGNAQMIADRIIEELEKEVKFLQQEKEFQEVLNGTTGEKSGQNSA